MARILRSIEGVAKADVSYRKKAAFVYAAKPLCNKKAVVMMNKKLKKGKYGAKFAEMKAHNALMVVKPMYPKNPPPLLPIIKLPSGKFGTNKLSIKHPRVLAPIRVVPPAYPPAKLPVVRLQVVRPKRRMLRLPGAPIKVQRIQKRPSSKRPSSKRFVFPKPPFRYRALPPSSRPAKR